ncbi:N2-citryl-N6-acetyl-N6-hydroxylysine synthase [Nitrosomonas aestuarii]|uniref:N2-citryl-N6-acetyl-N6-hydroxylysine synthase n=1 Tax=Nitrosomonas aestuarii TaxID=52441 RepID=A0A1I3ZFC0_9PROT|nr:IucA/IucC family protein [Nitrosomonas aestuarii]SFK42735.1 N2-citryl-N6-acetyl-N6-hydroxylysine synthase [Nitrosomonas aestuarii]
MNHQYLNTKQLAEKFSATALVNSLLREWHDFEVENNEIVFRNECKTLSIALEQYSNVGSHAYKNAFYRTIDRNKESLSFKMFVQELFQIINKKDGFHVLYPRVMESYQNLMRILNYRKPGYGALFRIKPLSFIDAEQALILGHNFHPCPKSKEQFKNHDHQSFAPEFGNAFALKWVLLKKENFFQMNSSNFVDEDWCANLFEQDHHEVVDSQYKPFPFHPWQFSVINKHHDIDTLIKNKHLIPIEKEGLLKWKATSSLRTIYCENSDYMLKFSLSLRITNSIRHLQAAEVVRGLQVHEVMNSTSGKQFLAEHPSFQILNEPSFLAIKGLSNPIILETIVLIRENPFKAHDKKEAIVLSTITQPNPYLDKGFFSSRSIDAKKWFGLYLENVLDPFIMAQADYGILFGAHQQNIIVQLNDNYPCGVIFRDCQGTGYTRLGYEKMKNEILSLDVNNGNVLDNPMAHALLGYYLIINSTFSLINALAAQQACTEETLLRMVLEYLQKKRSSHLLDYSFIDYLLNSSTLKQKGNFFCCLNGINENTEKNPLDIYNAIDNPLYKISKDSCNA